ncbi:MAG: hypothetical protein U1F43_05655 [Myxococcota bacterium]
MKHFGLIATSSLVVAAGALAAGCNVESVYCQSAHGAFAVKLNLKTGTGACSELKGGVFGVQSYNYAKSDGRPDPAKASMAIQAEDLGVLVDDAEARLGELPDPTHKPYAQGDFGSSKPDKDDLCHVPTMAEAIQNLPALPEVPPDPEDPDSVLQPAEPAKAFTYAWTNMAFLVTPAATGTQFSADLSFTQDGCTATYEAWGLYPAASCDKGDGTPDDNLCASEANPELGIATGSGINPDFPRVCDPDLLLCVLTAKPPVYK